MSRILFTRRNKLKHVEREFIPTGMGRSITLCNRSFDVESRWEGEDTEIKDPDGCLTCRDKVFGRPEKVRNIKPHRKHKYPL